MWLILGFVKSSKSWVELGIECMRYRYRPSVP